MGTRLFMFMMLSSAIITLLASASVDFNQTSIELRVNDVKVDVTSFQCKSGESVIKYYIPNTVTKNNLNRKTAEIRERCNHLNWCSGIGTIEIYTPKDLQGSIIVASETYLPLKDKVVGSKRIFSAIEKMCKVVNSKRTNDTIFTKTKRDEKDAILSITNGNEIECKETYLWQNLDYAKKEDCYGTFPKVTGSNDISYRPCECLELETTCETLLDDADSTWALSSCKDGDRLLHQLEFRDEYRSSSKTCWPESSANTIMNEGDIEETFRKSASKSYKEGKAKSLEDEYCRLRCYPSPCCSGSQVISETTVRQDGDGIPIKFKLCKKCICLPIKKSCNILVRTRSHIIDVELSSPIGEYDMTVGDNRLDGLFASNTKLQFEISEPGKYYLIGHCNQRYIKREVVWSLEDLCDSKMPGTLNLPMRYYCKNGHNIKLCFVLLLSSISIFLMRGPLSYVISFIFTVLTALVLYPFRKHMMCQLCHHVSFIKGIHECDFTSCFYCKDKYMADRDFLMLSKSKKSLLATKHVNQCVNAGKSNQFAKHISGLFIVAQKIVEFLIKRFSPLITIFFLFYLIGFTKADDTLNMKAIEEIAQIQRAESNKRLNIGLIVTVSFASLLYIVLYKTLCKICIRVAKKSNRLFERPICNLCENQLNDDNGMSRIYLEKRRSNVSVIITYIWLLLLSSLIFNKNIAEGSKDSDHKTVMSKIEDELQGFIKELQIEGYHPFHSRFSQNDYKEEISTASQEMDCTNEQCKLKLKIRAKFNVIDGKEFGYQVKPKEKLNLKEIDSEGFPLTFKTSGTQLLCKYKNIYKTGPVTHKSETSDTCTDGCDKCLESIEMKANGTIVENYHTGTSSWSCDGPWCMSINSGCTCGKCTCEITDHLYTVKSLLMQEPLMNLCIGVGGIGYCKVVHKDQHDKLIKVIELAKQEAQCPKIIACKDDKLCFKGSINDVDEFDEKFGSVKQINGFTTFKREERFTETCHFATTRSFTYSQCCKDTYHHYRDLKAINFGPSKENNNIYLLPVKDLGNWEMDIDIPNMIVQRDHVELNLIEVRIDNCKGCGDCTEGGSCLMNYNSRNNGIAKIDCFQCRLDSNIIQIKRGKHSTPFNIYCSNRQVELTCVVGNKSVSVSVNLIEDPKVPHGDGILNIDTTKLKKEGCDRILCGFSFVSLIPTWGLWTMASTILTLMFLLFIAFIIKTVLPVIRIRSKKGYKSV